MTQVAIDVSAHVQTRAGTARYLKGLLRELQRRRLPAHAWSGLSTGELFGYPLHQVELTDANAVATEKGAVELSVNVTVRSRNSIC